MIRRAEEIAWRCWHLMECAISNPMLLFMQRHADMRRASRKYLSFDCLLRFDVSDGWRRSLRKVSLIALLDGARSKRVVIVSRGDRDSGRALFLMSTTQLIISMLFHSQTRRTRESRCNRVAVSQAFCAPLLIVRIPTKAAVVFLSFSSCSFVTFHFLPLFHAPCLVFFR